MTQKKSSGSPKFNSKVSNSQVPSETSKTPSSDLLKCITSSNKIGHLFRKDPRLGHLEWPAYLIDLYRVFPRIIFILATGAVWQVSQWYMFGLLSEERTTEVSAFVAVVCGAWVKALDYYMQNGVNWATRMGLNGGEYSGKPTTTTDTKGG